MNKKGVLNHHIGTRRERNENVVPTVTGCIFVSGILPPSHPLHDCSELQRYFDCCAAPVSGPMLIRLKIKICLT